MLLYLFYIIKYKLHFNNVIISEKKKITRDISIVPIDKSK